jgi:hypothetical protein
MHVMVKIELVLKNDILTMPRAPTHAHDALEHLEGVEPLEEEERDRLESLLVALAVGWRK